MQVVARAGGALALDRDGEIFAWGYGPPGDGLAELFSAVPVRPCLGGARQGAHSGWGVPEPSRLAATALEEALHEIFGGARPPGAGGPPPRAFRLAFSFSRAARVRGRSERNLPEWRWRS